jgi:protein-arginine kinase activator protein McsA
MTEEELEIIAEKIFLKIMDYQKQYDEQFKDEMQRMINETTQGNAKEEILLGELARLHTILAQLEEKEKYEQAAVIKRKIEHVENKLNRL